MATNANARILVVEDDADLRQQLSELFRDEGLHVSEAADGAQAIETARRERPDLILLDMGLPKLSGRAVHERLRADFRTRMLPIVVLSADHDVDHKVERLAAGADDYITKPFSIAELTARVRAAIVRTHALRDLSPLTGLPGNAAITNEVNARIVGGHPFALLHVDLDDFKSFNDRYGFATGDEAIRALALALEDVVDRRGEVNDFAGHIGGDDLVILTSTDDPEGLAQEVLERFDAVAPDLHDPEDRERGRYRIVDRRGEAREMPLLSVSIGIARSSGRADESAAELAHLASEMKEVAKRRPGSAWEMDRRER